MPSKPETPSQAPAETDEKQLCVSCMSSNEPEAHFCAKCAAPRSSYAATGPCETPLAEGHIYRQAAQRPRNFIVVLGIWINFGAIALLGVVMLAFARDNGFGFVLIGVLLLAVSLVMIVKTTRNYRTGKKSDEKRDA